MDDDLPTEYDVIVVGTGKVILKMQSWRTFSPEDVSW